ncbi:dicarboxylate/amino acid:cation symporter [Bacteroidetes/Chlorobi group bacterium ChocPot_Mid]|jgi:Na+/H+-dicarboxylate symporter|nr:MAG: dicarboxylate/amino acid:cation symporter [Bacteroidetes/Chlorobi group bacterium ChocPot_Mid]
MSKKINIPLHIQIVIALILGAIFGSIFSIDEFKIKVTYLKDNRFVTETIKNFKSVEFNTLYEDSGDSLKKIFGKYDQIQIIKTFEKLTESEKKSLIITINSQDYKKIYVNKIYRNVVDLAKVDTIATYIKPVGTLFIKLLSFLAIPLVIASLIIGAASLEDIKKLGRIGLKTFTFYIVTTVIAISIGLAVANFIQPGKQLNETTKNRLIGTFQSDSESLITKNIDVDIVDFFLDIVPTNPINAMANGNMLQIVFFAVLFGVTLTFISREKSKPVIDLFDGISQAMIKMVDFIMLLAPFGVFALISSTIADFGFGIISTLFWYMSAVLIGLFLHTTFVYSFIVKFFGKMSPIFFFKGIRNVQAIGFSTSSSAATLPVNIKSCENNLGVPKQISGFVLPLGATINMDGTALYQGVAAVFIAQVYGFDLTFVQQITIVITAVLASIGTAPVPGVGIIMLVMILNAIHIPPEGIALIIGVDRILDMCRTITNVSGDAAVAVSITGLEVKKVT